MLRSLWGKFFLLLLLVSAVGLSATFFLRGMMLRDFESFLDGEQLDHVYIVTAELEGTWEFHSGWDLKSLSENAVLALMLGMEIKVHDRDGSLLMDTDRALEGLAPLMRRRVLSLAGDPGLPAPGEFIPYPLFLGGEQIGTMDIRFLGHDRSGIFVRRSGKFLALSFLIMGGLAVLGSFLASRRLTRPIKTLVLRTRAIIQGNLADRIPVTSVDEIGKLTLAFNEMAADLEIQESLRRKLISNVAHELRTPLAAMRAELEAMIDGVVSVGEDQVRSLHEETSRLAFILDGIDDLTQAQASSLSLERKEIVLGPFFTDIVGRFRASAGDKGVEIMIEADRDRVAWADPDRLSQIIINLVSNAIRATGSGGVITLTAAEEQGGSVIEVRDTGKGIPESEISHIFERFHRGPEGGLGLGLAIVRELVEAHGGRIEVQSEEGKGTTVRVIIPRE